LKDPYIVHLRKSDGQIQLCTQGLCLEEMTGQTVSEGALWYMQTRHRVLITFSDDLRTQTLATIAACANS